MNRYRYSLHLLIGAILFCAGAVGLRGEEGPFTLSAEEPRRTISVGQFTEFEITLSNSAPNDFDVRVIRIVDQMPDINWYSSICTLVECYPKEVDTLPVQTVYGDGGSIITFVHVFSIETAGTARVTLRFETLDGEHVMTQDLEVTASFPGSVEPGEPVAAALAAFPNPASESATIPLSVSTSGTESVRLELFDIRGARVADLSDDARRALDGGSAGVRVDLRALPAGYYRYRLDRDGIIRSGSLVVSR